MNMKFNETLKILLIIIFLLLIKQSSSTFLQNLLKASRCNKDSGLMTTDEKKIIITTHNKLRNQIALQTNVVGPKIPYATNMIQMYYSEAIGEKAQEWANKCLFKHSPKGFRKQPQFKTGENIYKISFIGGKPEKNWQKAIEAWYAEIKDFAGKSVDSFQAGAAATGHFTQIIWAYSYLIGCGFASYSDSPGSVTHLHVCQYGGVGNIIGFPIYMSSMTPACNCPGELACNNLTFTGLCCPVGHCNHNSIEFHGEPFKGTLPDI